MAKRSMSGIYRRVWDDLKDNSFYERLEKIGVKIPDRYNRMFEPYQEISWHRFEHFCRIYSWDWTWHDQIKDPACPDADAKHFSLLNVQYYLFFDTLFAVIKTDRWHIEDSEIIYNEFDDPTRVWQLGCVHKWREVPGDECRKRGIVHHGACFHVDMCVNPGCTVIRSCDSSD